MPPSTSRFRHVEGSGYPAPVSISTGTVRREVLTARNAVLATFFVNGVALASWASRIPAMREHLGLGPAALGLVLLAASVGSLGTPSTRA